LVSYFTEVMGCTLEPSEVSYRGVAQKLASCEMLHLHGKLGVAPLHVVHTLERSPRRGQTLKLSEKLSAFITG
jgi:hypothetical protein